MHSSMFVVTTILGIIFMLSYISDATINSSESQQLKRYRRNLGGEKASILDFPYLVNLDYNLLPDCGGSILSPYFVITAAHCVDSENNPESYRVRAGSSFRNRGGSVHYVFNITTHPNYSHTLYSLRYDVALLRLGNPIQMNNSTKKSVPMVDSGKNIQRGSLAVSAGWGCINENEYFRPEQFQSLGMRIIDKNFCRKIYNKYVPLEKDEICASASSRDHVVRGMCKGDSGGPLIVGGKLAGLVKSGGPNRDSRIHPNKFTEISKYRKWIDGLVDYDLKVKLHI